MSLEPLILLKKAKSQRVVDKEPLGHGWMHTKVAHILSHNAHFCRVPFLWTSTMNNKTYQIENLKLIIHEQLD
jgi:hypothetical protein